METPEPTLQAVQTAEPVIAPEPIEPVQAVEPVVPEPAPEPVVTEPVVAPKMFKLKVDGKEVEVDENELVNLGQKGFNYNQRVQALSDFEKANQQKLQLAEQLASDPNTVRYAIAKQLGYDPNLVMGNVQPPDPTYRESFPEQFGRQQAQFEIATQQKQAFDAAVNNILALNSQSANVAVFQKAMLEHNLDDGQSKQVQNFVTSRMRPNPAGFYSSEDVNYAVSALYGKEKLAEEKLKQADNIQKTIKEASRPASVSRKAAEDLSPEQKENRAYSEFLKDYAGGWTSKG